MGWLGWTGTVIAIVWMLAVLSYLSDILRELKNINHWVAETGMEAQRRNMALMGGFQAASPSQGTRSPPLPLTV
jgi:hypothetical protein